MKNAQNNPPWNVTVNGNPLVSEIEAIDSFLSAAVFITAREFAPNPSIIHSAEKLVSIQLGLSQTKEFKHKLVSLQLFEKKSKDKTDYYLKTSLSEDVYVVDAQAKEKINKSANDFRNTKLISTVERFSIKYFEISGKSFAPSPLILVQKDGKWVDESGKETIDSEKVALALERISGNRIKQFLTSQNTPKDVAKSEMTGIRIKVGDDAKSAKKEFTLWKSKSNQLYAKDYSNTSKETLEIDSTIRDAIPWEISKLKK